MTDDERRADELVPLHDVLEALGRYGADPELVAGVLRLKRSVRDARGDDEATCGTCGGRLSEPAMMSDDSYSEFSCPSPFHREAARLQDDDPTPAVTPEQVERANEMGRGGGTMRTRPARSPQDDDRNK